MTLVYVEHDYTQYYSVIENVTFTKFVFINFFLTKCASVGV